MQNIINKIKQATIFKSLDDKELQHLISISTVKAFKKGNVVFYKDDSSTYLHVLLDGTLKVYKHNIKGNEIVLKTISDITLVAELANFEKINYPSNCEALSDSEILLIDYNEFEKYFLSNTKFLLLFVKSLTKKIINLEQVISTNLTLDATAKVAKYIYESENCYLENSNAKSASLLNITPETFSRIIRRFKDEKILVEDETKLKIKDKEKLKEYFI